MSLSIGIVGFPNVGKSTLFNALLKQRVALAANYPFATIEPNVGIAEVPDERLPILAEIVGTKVIRPATVEFTDIAGLVKGASQGEGLGNQFLAHIRETDVICHVLRAFQDEQVLREGAENPVADLETIRLELQLADLTTLSKLVKSKDQNLANIQRFITNLEKEQMLNSIQLIEDEVKTARELALLTAKPEIFVINADEADLTQAAQLRQTYAQKLHVRPEQVVIISAQIESELSSLNQEDQKLYLQDLGLEHSGLERLAEVAYQTLKLQSFLTAGEKEVRAWTIKQGTTAQEAAGVIHTDFAKKFISAHITDYQNFVEVRGWKGVKEKGKLRQEGRGYLMKEGDVVEFMIGS